MDNLERILQDLSKHHRDKSTLMVEAVNSRLSKSIEAYYKELTDSFNYLAKQNNTARIMRNV